MPKRRPPWWMYVVLVPCATYVVLAWYLYAAGPETPGFIVQPRGSSQVVLAIQPGLAADRAGLKVGDRLVGVNGRPVDPVALREISRNYVGQAVRLTVERNGRRQTIAWTTGRATLAYWTDPEGLAQLALVPSAALCTVLAWLIAFRRPEDAAARLGALLFAISAVTETHLLHRPTGWSAFVASLPVPVAILPLVAALTTTISGPLRVMFLASFPRAPVRTPWIWAVVSLPAAVLLAAGMAQLARDVYLWPAPRVIQSRFTALSISLIYVLVAVLALLWNYRRLTDIGERRRVRLFVAGVVITMAPVLFEGALLMVAGAGVGWARALLLAYWLSPLFILGAVTTLAGDLAQAYAILHHRLFDVRVMVRQGLQYAAARRLLLGLVPLLGLVFLVDLGLQRDQTMAQAFVRRGWFYAALGAAALVAHANRAAWLGALDRRFFRDQYDAQRILRSVLTEVRQAGTLRDAAPRALGQIDAALHPESAAVMGRRPDDAAFSAISSLGAAPVEIPARSKLLALLRVLGKSVQVESSETGWLRRQLPPEETRWLATARIEWIFPIALGEGQAEALLVLGPRRSQEPYSREDQDLVEAVASGLALVHDRLTPASVPSSRSGALRSADLVAPSVAPRYIITRELGRGGMGTVYEARDMELERSVAIKVMRPDLMASPEAITRFKREARAAAGFSHPNVVTVHDVGVADDGRAYLVMELLAGDTLRAALKKDRRLGPERASRIFRGVCAAVDAAHQRHLLHRDLKPENIFLARGEDGEVPKILDFGVAKLLVAGDETVTVGDTSPGQLLGTLAYMSPEQLQGGPPDPSWDVWALAVMAYEMVAGAHPFAGPETRRIAELTSRRPAPVRTHLGPEGDRWEGFFSRALAPEPCERPASARALLTEFEAMLA